MEAKLGTSRLGALLESAQLLHSSLDLDPLLRHLLRTVMGRLLATKAVIAVRNEGRMEVALVRGVQGLQKGEEFLPETARELGFDVVYDIGEQPQPTGVLAVGNLFRLPQAEDEDFLKALLGIAAGGIRNAAAHSRAQQLNEDLDQKIQDLRTLLELVQSFTSTLQPVEVARLLVLTLSGRWGVSRHALSVCSRGRPPLLLTRGLQLPPREVLAGALEFLSDPVRVVDLPNSEIRSILQSQKGEVVFPLRSADEWLGLLVMGTRIGGRTYQDSDLDFGRGLVAQAVVAFENCWYFQETLEKRKIEQEVEVAAGIQRELFPACLPRLEGFEIAARSLAARQVGGDYYDCLSVAEGVDTPHLLCVADISGKGIPASLLMSNIQATLRALLRECPNLVDLISRTSKLLFETTPSNKYATAIVCSIRPQQDTIEYVNGGHNDGLLLKADGTVQHLHSTGPPVGLIPSIPFQQAQVEMQPGDLLALYSDGVVEAQNEAEEEFEEERFLRVLKEARGLEAKQVIDKVFEAVQAFAGRAPQHDDITLMIVKKA